MLLSIRSVERQGLANQSGPTHCLSIASLILLQASGLANYAASAYSIAFERALALRLAPAPNHAL